MVCVPHIRHAVKWRKRVIKYKIKIWEVVCIDENEVLKAFKENDQESINRIVSEKANANLVFSDGSGMTILMLAAVDALSRRPGKKYFDYIDRLCKN